MRVIAGTVKGSWRYTIKGVAFHSMVIDHGMKGHNFPAEIL